MLLNALITFLVLALVLWVVCWVITKFLPGFPSQIAWVICGIILIIAALRIFGLWTPVL